MTIDGRRDIVLLDGGIGQEIHRRSTRGDPHPLWSVMVMREEPDVVVQDYKDSVSYTHLTLPTNSRV